MSSYFVRPNIRARPVDLEKKLPIVRSAQELFDEDDGGFLTQVHYVPYALEASKRDESAPSPEEPKASPAKADTEIPIPGVRKISGYDQVQDTFQRANTYIRADPTEYNDLKDSLRVDYDVDSADERFLTHLNRDDTCVSWETFEYIMDRLEKESAKKSCLVPLSQAQRAVNMQGAGLTQVYNHWLMRRKQRPKAIIVNLRPPPDINDPDPNVPFRPREAPRMKKARKNDMSAFVKLKQIRAEFERVRQLMDLIKRRERCKKEILQVNMEVVEMQRGIYRPKLKFEKEFAPPYRPRSPHLFPMVPSSGGKIKSLHLFLRPHDLFQPYEPSLPRLVSPLASSFSSRDPNGAYGTMSPQSSEPFTSPEHEQPIQLPRPTSTLSHDGSIPTTPAQRFELYHDGYFTAPFQPPHKRWTCHPLRGRGRVGRGGRILFDRPRPDSCVVPILGEDPEASASDDEDLPVHEIVAKYWAAQPMDT